ncbi:uncharacterized protein VTP21DRAFT_8990 [Calcarisporiella thermophila]|uniref:uncharacterized protein n=1 Tax=Calcarisporiella thermophila TaxID=911321 RepID=UPI0037440880
MKNSFLALSLFILTTCTASIAQETTATKCNPTELDIDVYAKPNFDDFEYANGSLKSNECYTMKIDHHVGSYKISKGSQITFFPERRCKGKAVYSGKESNAKTDFTARSFKITCYN